MKRWAIFALLMGGATFALMPASDPNTAAILPNGYELNIEAAKYWLSILVAVMSALAASNPTIARYWSVVKKYAVKIPVIGRMFSEDYEPEEGSDADNVSDVVEYIINGVGLVDRLIDRFGDPKGNLAQARAELANAGKAAFAEALKTELDEPNVQSRQPMDRPVHG